MLELFGGVLDDLLKARKVVVCLEGPLFGERLKEMRTQRKERRCGVGGFSHRGLGREIADVAFEGACACLGCAIRGQRSKQIKAHPSDF